ncbi:TPR-like protein [Hysterangium stoloniferum]|nr:TPR-like protein [Hysterangium stoloniferum]
MLLRLRRSSRTGITLAYSFQRLYSLNSRGTSICRSHFLQDSGLKRIPSLARRWATSTTPHSVAADPAEAEAISCLEKGTQKLEEGDVEAARTLYQRSVEIKRTASSLFNLGVTHYHLKDFKQAIEAWNECVALSPNSADAHTNLASAYILSSQAPRPDLALQHLQIASDLSPEDPEIAFNLAAVLEACGHLENALEHYKRAKKYGVEKAEVHIRNISAKILGKKMKDLDGCEISSS